MSRRPAHRKRPKPSLGWTIALAVAAAWLSIMSVAAVALDFSGDLNGTVSSQTKHTRPKPVATTTTPAQLTPSSVPETTRAPSPSSETVSTVTVTVAGRTVVSTVTAPGRTDTVTAPGETVTETQTVTAPGETVTVTETATVSVLPGG